jgi:peptidoglycan hydrolase-like protein with peptidoglycan-binding domain
MSLPTLEALPLEAQAGETGGYKYRPLAQARPGKPVCKGWDVYALQTALLGLGYSLPRFGADGWLGSEGDAAIKAFQSHEGLVVDGIAGILTQRALLIRLAEKFTREQNLPARLLEGQIESECGFQLGNFTPYYPNGKRDLGPVQQNLTPTTESCRNAFDARAAVSKLASDSERGLRVRKDRYRKQPGAQNDVRAWELAAGSWNAPSWADTLAAGKPLPQQYRDRIEAYIDRVTRYADLNLP